MTAAALVKSRINRSAVSAAAPSAMMIAAPREDRRGRHERAKRTGQDDETHASVFFV
jgi:hypothetical protein